MYRSPFICALLLVGPVLGQTQFVYTISTIAGTGAAGYSGDDGPAIDATFNTPRGVTMDPSGNVYIADVANNVIRRIATDGSISTFAGTGVAGYSGDGGPATEANLNEPYRVAADKSGNVYIADTGNSRVRVVDGHGIITTVAGNGNSGPFSGAGGPATQATIGPVADCYPDNNGNLYIAADFVVLKVDASGNITNIAGNGNFGYSGDGGPATSATLSIDAFVIADSAGNVYICDQTNNRIREVSNGVITTVAGNGNAAFSGDGGPAIKASLNAPSGMYLDSAGDLFIADGGNYRIRVVTPDGAINTIAGNGSAGFGGDGGPATAAMIDPHGLAPSAGGGWYFADTSNERIRELTPVATQSPSIASAKSATDFGGFTAGAPGTWMELYGSNLAAASRMWSSTDFTGGTAPSVLGGTSVKVDGQPAFVSYVSPTQVDFQMPSDVAPGQRPVVVTTTAGASNSYSLTVNATEPGLLAPSSFNIGGNQYVVAYFPDGSYVLPPGLINGVTSNRATPGDVITIYGVGFGPVTPAVAGGQIARETTALENSLQVSIGGVAASVQYAGMAVGYVGLYQFNVVVPNVAASDSVPLTFQLGSVSSSQTLYVAVQN